MLGPLQWDLLSGNAESSRSIVAMTTSSLIYQQWFKAVVKLLTISFYEVPCYMILTDLPAGQKQVFSTDMLTMWLFSINCAKGINTFDWGSCNVHLFFDNVLCIKPKRNHWINTFGNNRPTTIKVKQKPKLPHHFKVKVSNNTECIYCLLTVCTCWP